LSSIASSCEKARNYFYNFLTFDYVPEAVIEHYRGCLKCRKIMVVINSIFAAIDLSDIEKETLAMQYALCNAPVNCVTAKRHFALLLNLEHEITTPITVHIDNCVNCREDYCFIKGLDLSKEEIIELHNLLHSHNVVVGHYDSDIQHFLREISDEKGGDVVTTYDVVSFRIKVATQMNSLDYALKVFKRIAVPPLPKSVKDSIRKILRRYKWKSRLKLMLKPAVLRWLYSQ